MEKQAKVLTKALSVNKAIQSIDFGSMTENQYKYIVSNCQNKNVEIVKPLKFRIPKKRNAVSTTSVEKKLERLGVKKRTTSKIPLPKR